MMNAVYVVALASQLAIVTVMVMWTSVVYVVKQFLLAVIMLVVPL